MAVTDEQIAEMFRITEMNGMASGGTMFCSVSAAVEALRESGKYEQASALESAAQPGDLIRIQDGRMYLEGAE